MIEITIGMALAPLPGHIDAKLYREAQITTAAKQAMGSAAPLKGPLAISLSMSYPPGASMRKGHVWRIVAPSCWDLSRFVIPLLQGICFASAGQIAKLEVTKVYGSRALTLVTVKQLVE